MDTEKALENARNNQLNEYLDSQELSQKDIDLDEIEKSVISDFQDMVKRDSFEDAITWLAGSFVDEAIDNAIDDMVKRDSFEDAITWLAGSFVDEAIDNAIDIIIGKTNDYFTDLISLKAKEIKES